MCFHTPAHKQTSRVAPMKPDFNVANHGSIFLLTPLSKDAHAWIRENVEVEGWMTFGESIAIGHRYIGDIVDGMLDAGFTHN